ncbi:MAG TPA: VCBS repeat-containing protein [Pyrinomonadaceae bacterium]
MQKAFFVIGLSALISFAAAAQSKVVPIVDMKVGGLLGGVENGKFFDAKTTIERLEAEQDYTLYLPGKKSEKLRLKKPTNSQDVCDDFYGLDYEGIDAETRHEKGGVALGDGYRWNPQPRAIKAIALNNAAYKKIMNDFLRTKRITTPVAKLDQAFSVDLDGDGREEVILTATRADRSFQPKPKRRTYDGFSVVLIRKTVNGKIRNIVLDGEFHPKSDAFYDGYTYAVSSVADLNGDGKLEILLHGEYYEGSSTGVYELNGSKASYVEGLGAGCGL